MGKNSNYPVILERCDFLSISNLKKWDYLKDDQIKTGFIRWQENSISITANMKQPAMIILQYHFRGQPIETRINLVNRCTNFGGVVWYFICPLSKKRCRKLYLIHGRFVYRLAVKNVFYQNQVESHGQRHIYRAIGFIFDKLDLPRYYKKTYAGKTTKRFNRHLRKIEFYRQTMDESFLHPMIKNDSVNKC